MQDEAADGADAVKGCALGALEDLPAQRAWNRGAGVTKSRAAIPWRT